MSGDEASVLGHHPAVRVTFLDDTPAMFQRALARPFEAKGLRVDLLTKPPPPYKAVGPDVGVIVESLAGAVAAGVAYDLAKHACRQAIAALREVLAEVPFDAQIIVRGEAEPTEYVLPGGDQGGPALDGFLDDLEAGRWRGGRLSWRPDDGWVHEPDAAQGAGGVESFGSLSEADANAWVEAQLQIGAAHGARVAWVMKQLNDNQGPQGD